MWLYQSANNTNSKKLKKWTINILIQMYIVKDLWVYSFRKNHLGVSSEEYRSMEYRRSEYRSVQKVAQVDIWVLSLFEPSQISPHTSPDHRTPSCDFAQGSSSHHQSTPLSLDKVQSTLLLTFVHLLFMCCYARFFLVLCSKIFCQACTAKTCKLAASKKPVRVCDKCHDELTK